MQDVIDQKGFPRSWDELAPRLRESFLCHIRAALDSVLSGRPNQGGPNVETLVAEVFVNFHWSVIARCHWILAVLQQQPAKLTRLHDWIEHRINELAVRFATPDPLFCNEDLLRELSHDWEAFRKPLGLSGKARGVKREEIQRKRVAYVAKLKQKQECELSSAEISTEYPYPRSFQRLAMLILNREQAEQFHFTALMHLRRRLAYMARNNSNSSGTLPDEPEVLHEFLLLRAFRIWKNASAWLTTAAHRTPGSWAACVFNCFSEDVGHAIDYVQNRRTNWRAEFPMDSLDQSQRKELLTSKEPDPATIPLDEEDILEAERLDEARLQREIESERTEASLRRSWLAYLRKILANAREELLAILPLVADSSLNREQFAEEMGGKEKGWDVERVNQLCAELEQLIRDYAAKNGPPPGMRLR